MGIMIDIGTFWNPMECPTCHKINWVETKMDYMQDIDLVTCWQCGETHWVDEIAKEYWDSIGHRDPEISYREGEEIGQLTVFGYEQPIVLTKQTENDLDEITQQLNEVFHGDDAGRN